MSTPKASSLRDPLDRPREPLLYTDRLFEKMTVSIDDGEFVRCRFESCEIVWSGFYFSFTDCQFGGAMTLTLKNSIAECTWRLLNIIGALAPAGGAPGTVSEGVGEGVPAPVQQKPGKRVRKKTARNG